MRGFLAFLNRYLPVVLFVLALMAIIQFGSQHVPSWSALHTWGRHLAQMLQIHPWTILTLALVVWTVVLLGLLHETQRLPGWLKRRKRLVDVLDRLTNKAQLEQKLAQATDPVFLNAETLAATLKTRVIGQDRICDELAAQIRRRLALRTRGKPVGVFLFAGPPGSGKTYLAKRLAIALERPLLHLDMTQFARGGMAATQLFGSSKGYVGSDSYGKLTAALRDTPDAVILLDEFEKAHAEVHKNFLTAWNDGFITEASDGRPLSTVRALFVLTTNAAVDILADLALQCADRPDELRRASTQALKDAGIAPEVLNRIDRIFVFAPLKGLDIARVTALEIEAVIQGYGLEVADGGISPDILLGLLRRQEGLGGTASSRDLVRAIEESIADSLIEARQQGAQRIMLVERDGMVCAQSEEARQP